jgi:hypothetical protein
MLPLYRNPSIKNLFSLCLSLGLSVLILSSSAAAEQTDYPLAQKFGALFQLPIGARGSALGQGLSANSEGLEALSWNSAGLIYGTPHEVLVDYTSLYGDMNCETLGYAMRPNDNFALGLAATYLSYGGIERYDLDDYGYPVRTQQTMYPNSILVKLGGAQRLSPQVSIGLSLKWLREDLVEKVYNFLSGDIGLETRTGVDGLKCAMTIRNIGRPIGEFTMPLTSSLGVAYGFSTGLLGSDHLTLILDGILPESQALQAGVGMEYQFFEKTALRAGYRTGDTRAAESFLTGFLFCMGVTLGAYVLNYAYSPDPLMGDGHRITLEYNFGVVQKKASKTKSTTEKKGGQYLFEFLR